MAQVHGKGSKPVPSMAAKVVPKASLGDVTVKINVDTSELDEAIEKARELMEMVATIGSRWQRAINRLKKWTGR